MAYVTTSRFWVLVSVVAGLIGVEGRNPEVEGVVGVSGVAHATAELADAEQVGDGLLGGCPVPGAAGVRAQGPCFVSFRDLGEGCAQFAEHDDQRINPAQVLPHWTKITNYSCLRDHLLRPFTESRHF